MKNLILIPLLFITIQLFGQINYYPISCPEDEIIDFEHYNDTLVLTIIYYELEYNYYPNMQWDYIKKIKKIVYEAQELFTIKGKVIPKRIVEETYKFENDFKFTYSDTIYNHFDFGDTLFLSDSLFIYINDEYYYDGDTLKSVIETPKTEDENQFMVIDTSMIQYIKDRYYDE